MDTDMDTPATGSGDVGSAAAAAGEAVPGMSQADKDANAAAQVQ